jgi:hypothetical protein
MRLCVIDLLCLLRLSLCLSAALEKHRKLSHTKVRCECGVEMDPSMVDTHKGFECDRRPVECQYCHLNQEERSLGRHEVRRALCLPSSPLNLACDVEMSAAPHITPSLTRVWIWCPHRCTARSQADALSLRP